MISPNEYLSKSIDDIQSIIRALDVKLGALLTASLIPFSALRRIWDHFCHLHQALPCHYGMFLGIIFFTLCTATIYTLVKGLLAIDNPARHIVAKSHPIGTFYRGGLYNINFWDSFKNRPNVCSKIDLDQLIDELPKSETDIQKELAYEQMKLAYIRDIKIRRATSAFQLGSAWLLIATLSFVLSKIYS